MNPTATPRTDANILSASCNWSLYRDYVNGDFARTLETELNAALAREATMRSLIREVMGWHSDSKSPDYNECETEVSRCHWCEMAAAALAEASQAVATVSKHMHAAWQSSKDNACNFRRVDVKRIVGERELAAALARIAELERK